MKAGLDIALVVVAVGLFAGVARFGRGGDGAAVAEGVAQGALLIDVRTPREFDGGHIEGAINIPYDSIDRVIHQSAPEPDAAIVVYCRSGRRSAIATDSLARFGYTNVIDAGSIGAARAALGR